MAYLLGIDIGTSGAKAVLFDERGGAVCERTVEYPLSQPRNGWAEQDSEHWKNAVLEGVRYVISGVDAADVKGIGLSGQMHGLVMLDAENKPIRPSIIWCDQRTAAECAEITDKVGAARLLEITANPALTGFTASKILWVKNNEPQNFEKCRHILLPKDYIRFVLTGEFATEVSDASGMQLLDVANRCWSKEVCGALGIDMSMLAEVYESPEITGRVTKRAADATGLKQGTIVVGGAGDNAAAAVGTGVVRDGDAFTTIGSSGVVYAHSSAVATDPKGRVHTFCCAVPGKWHVMGVTQAAGLSLRWFRDNFCAEEIAAAKEKGIDPYDIMMEMAAGSKIGAESLLFLPYLMGERTPHLDPDCRGMFFGISAIHRKADFIRSIMEGVAFSQRDSMEILREMGIQIGSMAACGGGGASPLWRKILADVYKCPVHTLVTKEGPALGAAILAGVGAGIYSAVEEGCDVAVTRGGSQQPDERASMAYDEFYGLYAELYPAVKALYGRLSRMP